MDQQSTVAHTFHILCPDREILTGFRASNRLFLALQWHTPHQTRCVTRLSQEEIDLLDESHHIFSFFPLIPFNGSMRNFLELSHQAKAKGADCFLYTFTPQVFNDHKSMIDHLVELIIVELTAIYDRPD
jgi:hypothetical protein